MAYSVRKEEVTARALRGFGERPTDFQFSNSY